jgi:hypothetical protein
MLGILLITSNQINNFYKSFGQHIVEENRVYQLYVQENSIIQSEQNTNIQSYNWQWMPGTFFGVTCGFYGSLVGLLASKGKAKKFVFGFGILLMSLSFLMLIAGIVLLLLQQPFFNWYAFMLPGFIGVILSISLKSVVVKRYEEFEERKVNANDILGY